VVVDADRRFDDCSGQHWLPSAMYCLKRLQQKKPSTLLLGRILGFPGVFGARFPDSPHPGTGQPRRPSG
jgi:hypothetical protein